MEKTSYTEGKRSGGGKQENGRNLPWRRGGHVSLKHFVIECGSLRKSGTTSTDCLIGCPGRRRRLNLSLYLPFPSLLPLPSLFVTFFSVFFASTSFVFFLPFFAFFPCLAFTFHCSPSSLCQLLPSHRVFCFVTFPFPTLLRP